METIVNIGILEAEVIEFELNGTYFFKEGSIKISGKQKLSYHHGLIKIDSLEKQFSELTFIPDIYEKAVAEIQNVVIGINFHWEQSQKQSLQGKLIFKISGDKISLINHLFSEDYLKSVISSEMKASSHIELLKAHAIISRSWLFAQIQRRKKGKQKQQTEFSTSSNENELIKWYDSNDHTEFDVCADDHCQRYQGITTISTQKAIEAVEATKGQVLMYKMELCDARFSKSCGGVSENFENVWENTHLPYLTKIIDNDSITEISSSDLKIEENAKKWILSNPPAFCNNKDKPILSQILNDYDLETNFYRWEENFTQMEISELIRSKSGIDFGEIISLKAIERGESARIIKLEIKGTKKTLIIGKELEIRRILSKTHLFSSAFVVEISKIRNNIPQKIKLKGAGWGHGVGLCQIGAAVMANKGYNYKEILAHYFKGADLY